MLLRYVGNSYPDGMKRSVTGVPGTDLTRAQVVDVAATRRMEPDAVVAWLLETDAYTEPDDDDFEPPATPLEETPDHEPDEPEVSPAGMAPEAPSNPGAWQPFRTAE